MIERGRIDEGDLPTSTRNRAFHNLNLACATAQSCAYASDVFSQCRVKKLSIWSVTFSSHS